MHCAVYQYDSIIFPQHDQVKEFIDSYSAFTIEQKLERAKANPEGRYIYYFEDSLFDFSPSTLMELKDLSAARENIIYMLHVKDSEVAKQFQDIPHFYSFDYAATTLDEVFAQGSEKNVSDVYITGEVCFKMTDVRNLADHLGVNIRLIPNFPQRLLSKDDENAIRSFWIRPEDLELYSSFVDVIEFTVPDLKLQRVYYEVYFEDKRWNKDFGVLVPFLEDVCNEHLTSDFTKSRLNCGKRCVLRLCTACNRHNALAQTLKENELAIDHQDKDNKYLELVKFEAGRVDIL